MRFSRAARAVAITAVTSLIAVSMVVVAQPALADTAPPDPIATVSTVSSDPLPTVQVDGLVWGQAIAGSTVFAGGEFGTARPAGAAEGTNTVVRNNLLSYNLQTGVLNSSWAPNPNARIRNLTVSPDKSRVYVAGNFTSIGGSTRYRLASFDTSTGALTSFRPVINGKVNDIAVTANTIYVVGGFTVVNNVAVSGAAAFDVATGALKPDWKPVIQDGQAISVTAKADGSKVVLGGNFTSVNGSSNPGYGLAMVDGASGGTLAFNVNNVVRNAGANAAISAVESDDSGIYGTGQHYGTGTLEGTFYSDWNGNMIWVEDCHGDTYAVYPDKDVVYTTGHVHYCGNIGAFPQTDPWSFSRALGFTKAVKGTITADPLGYTNWAGTPRPDLLHWFPDFNTGNISGLAQAAWSIGGNDDYILYGGEFTRVNNVPQQGIVRFAKKNLAPNKDGPRLGASNYKPSVASFVSGQARVSWLANYDRDNTRLKYEVIRNGNTAAPVYTQTLDSNFWTRPAMNFTDTGLTPGATYTYRIKVTDPFGNVNQGENVSVVASDGQLSAYASGVLNDAPQDFWRLGESSGPTVSDWAGAYDAIAGDGVTFGTPGAIGSDTNTAATFSGSSGGLVATQSAIAGPNTFAIEAWFKTTTTTGGKIVGFGNANTGTSSSYDRHVYMDGSGRVIFGVYPGASRTLQSGTGFNNGQWHHVVANLSPSGMQLYVDGARVGQRTDTTFGQAYSGYWRIGGDSPWAGDAWFDGAIDDVAIYSAPLTPAKVNAHYVTSGRTSSLPAAPADPYGALIYGQNSDVYWRLGETGNASTAADASISRNNGNYSGSPTKGVAGGIVGTTNTAVSFDGQNDVVATQTQFVAPTVYSEELWFNTTTTRGGKLIGFGSAQTGSSSNYDRHVYMRDDGRLVFGVWTGQENTIVTNAAYNNGQWHHMVATQSADGMRLYLDGQLAGSNPQAQAESYPGYWRIGGDTTWSGATSAYIQARIDEVAIYSVALTAEDVLSHYGRGSGNIPNVPPTAAFTPVPSELKVAVNASASSDSDGSISSYQWNFGDGSTGTGVSTTHDYAVGGSYVIGLTVTDDDGATTTSTQTVLIPSPNVLPAANFDITAEYLTVDVDATASTDSDGTIASYAWNFGDGTGTATGATAEYSYAKAGDYTVTLTVTDDDGGTNTSTQSVTTTAPPNVPPVADFDMTAEYLKVTVDASDSSDSDGSVASYAWDFGGLHSSTGVSSEFTFTSAGTYSVSLTVTDDEGATTTSTKSVTVALPPDPSILAADTFNRTVAGSLGSAETGGPWTVTTGANRFSVADGQGIFTVPRGATLRGTLAGVSATSTDLRTTVTLDETPGASSTYVSVYGRVIGTQSYAAKLRFYSNGAVTLQLSGGSTVVVPGVTYAAGQQLNVRLQVFGTSPTTIQAKVWPTSGTEPAAWTASTTSTTAGLQTAGSVALESFLPSTATATSAKVRFDNLLVTVVG